MTVYESKGGKAEDTVGTKCLCNALMANIGLPQVRGSKYTEQALVTTGNDLTEICRFLPEGSDTYTAEDVIRKLLSLAHPCE